MAMLCHGSTNMGRPCKSTGDLHLTPGYPWSSLGYLWSKVKLLKLQIFDLPTWIYHPFILFFAFIWEAIWNAWTVALCIFSHAQLFFPLSHSVCCFIHCVVFWSQSRVLILSRSRTSFRSMCSRWCILVSEQCAGVRCSNGSIEGCWRTIATTLRPSLPITSTWARKVSVTFFQLPFGYQKSSFRALQSKKIKNKMPNILSIYLIYRPFDFLPCFSFFISDLIAKATIEGPFPLFAFEF